MTAAKPLTPEEELDVRDRLMRGHVATEELQRLYATIDAERAARAEAEAKVADANHIVARNMRELENATAKRIAEWLRGEATDMSTGKGVLFAAIAGSIERGAWRR